MKGYGDTLMIFDKDSYEYEVDWAATESLRGAIRAARKGCPISYRKRLLRSIA